MPTINDTLVLIEKNNDELLKLIPLIKKCYGIPVNTNNTNVDSEPKTFEEIVASYCESVAKLSNAVKEVTELQERQKELMQKPKKSIWSCFSAKNVH